MQRDLQVFVGAALIANFSRCSRLKSLLQIIETSAFFAPQQPLRLRSYGDFPPYGADHSSRVVVKISSAEAIWSQIGRN